MDKTELKKVWQRFAEGKDFVLNPEENQVDGVADGILANQQKFGLKLCPCQLRDGTRQRDLQLICPCNFKAQTNWQKLGRCWCGLFVKR